MKSNFAERFNEVFEKYKELGIFNIDDMVDEMMDGFRIVTEKRREKDRYILKDRLESMLSQNDCFSYAKNQHVMLDQATLEKLKDIDQTMVSDITSRAKTLQRIREKEKEAIDGQMAFDLQTGSLKEEQRLSNLLSQGANG